MPPGCSSPLRSSVFVFAHWMFCKRCGLPYHMYSCILYLARVSVPAYSILAQEAKRSLDGLEARLRSEQAEAEVLRQRVAVLEATVEGRAGEENQGDCDRTGGARDTE